MCAYWAFACVFNGCIRLWLGLKKAFVQHYLVMLLTDIMHHFYRSRIMLNKYTFPAMRSLSHG